MKYLVNMVDPRGKRKNVILEASSCKEATNLASDKYINYDLINTNITDDLLYINKGNVYNNLTISIEAIRSNKLLSTIHFKNVV